MPVGHKQFTEIAREINREKTKILVLDEPTAVLTETEAEVLIKALRKLAAPGIAIIFISHRLHEVIEVADRVVVLRDGRDRQGHSDGRGHRPGYRLLDGGPAGGGRAGRMKVCARLHRGHPVGERPVGGHARRDGQGHGLHREERARSSASAAWPARASWASPTASWGCSRPAARSGCTARPVP